MEMHDVAIVGLGPTGATLANLLGAAGLSVLVLEKEAGIFPLPRAIHFDGEVLRILQGAGLRERVLAIARPGEQGMHFVNGAGETMLIRGGSAALGPHGCANNYYFHQPELEAVLRVCRKSRSLSEAGRQLFQASRAQRSVVNDADRLRKYLAKFGLEWGTMTSA